MDSREQMAIEQQQAEQLRRQQLEQQRRLEEQQRRELDEREQRQRELDEAELAAQEQTQRRRQRLHGEQEEQGDEERKNAQRDHEAEQTAQDRLARKRRSRLWPFNTGTANDAQDDDEDGAEDAGDERDGPPEHHQVSAASSGGTSLIAWLVGLLVVIGLGAWAVPKWFQGTGIETSAAKETTAKPAAPALALALPEENQPTLAPGALPDVKPSDAPQAGLPAPLAASGKPDAVAQEALAQQHPHDALAAAVPAANAVGTQAGQPAGMQAAPSTQQDAPAQNAQLAALSTRVTELEATLAALHAQRPKTAHAPQTRAPRVARSDAQGLPAKPAPLSTPSTPATQPQLLAIDTWAGQPSVVIGTDAPGDKRVRILQPGESLNGITLESVDMAAGRATFTVGTGKRVTLDLADGGTR